MSQYLKDIDYKLLDKKTVYKGKRITVEELNYYNPRNDKKVYREHVVSGEAAIIVPVTDDNEFIMIQEPRTPIGKTILAFPAGLIEQGEELEKGAIRELEEETGYLAKSIKRMREVYPAVGYSDEKITIFLAKDLIKTQRYLDETEDIQVLKIKIEEVKELLDKNEIVTANEIVAILHYFTYEYNK